MFYSFKTLILKRKIMNESNEWVHNILHFRHNYKEAILLIKNHFCIFAPYMKFEETNNFNNLPS